MFRQLDLRDRLIAMAGAPLLIIAAVAIGLLATGAPVFALFAVLGLAGAGFVSLSVGRSVIESLAEVADGATAIATAIGEQTSQAQPLETTDSGSLGQVVTAINGINAATNEAGRTRHDEVREGLRSIVTNLARRSQTLLDRQVEYLDQLESSEEDPDRLDQLFKVDHLATRMRRNAESLIVLADADPGRRRGGPVDIADVLRVAMGEVEIYQQIELVDIQDGQVSAGVAVDLAHLVAELMENATQFSPPSSPVEVTGRFDGRGTFTISVADQGMGMTPERLAETNELLANPPELGLEMGRSLGFKVVGRLAQRLDAKVVVDASTEGSGLTAVISVPSQLFVAPSRDQVPASSIALTESQIAAESGAIASSAPFIESGPFAESSPFAEPSVVSEAGKSGSSSKVGKLKGDTAEMLKPLAPPPGAAASGELHGPTIASDSESVDPFDWGVGSMVDGGQSVAGSDKNFGRPVDTGSDAGTDTDPADEWQPPEVTPDPPAKLAEAVPSGDAFESGVASLLDDSATDDRPPRGLRDAEATAAGLTRRHRSATEETTGADRPLASAKRDPEEVRSRLMRYREGLSGRKPKLGARQSDSGESESGQSQDDQTEPGQSEPNKSEGR